MNALRIEAVIDCQSDLLTAIARQDLPAVLRASEALTAAVAALEDSDHWPDFEPAARRLRLAITRNQDALRRLSLLAKDKDHKQTGDLGRFPGRRGR